MRNLGFIFALYLACSTSYALNTPILKATPLTVEKNQQASLSWSAVGATSCTPSWTKTKTVANGTLMTPSLAGDTSFYVVCKDAKGQIATSTKVTVKVRSFMNVEVNARNSEVPEGGTTTLSWKSDNASYCSTSWGSYAKGPTSGTETSPILFKDQQFSVSCTNQNGVSETSSVTVKRAPLSLVFVAGTSTVTIGGTTTLSYKASGAGTCVTSWNKSLKSVVATTSSPLVTKDTKLTVTCKSPLGKTVAKSVTLKAAKAELAVAKTVSHSGTVLGTSSVLTSVPFSLSLSVPTHVVKKGNPVTLSWKSEGIRTCSSSFTGGVVATSGTYTIKKVTKSITPTLTCTTTSGLPISRNVQIGIK